MKHLRNTRQRQLVLEAVQTCKGHPTADQLYLHIRSLDPKISRGTVYRNLKVLAQAGEIHHVNVSGIERFDWRTERHDHLICTSCGMICDAPTPYDHTLDKRLSNETGYTGVQHRTIYRGRCPDCALKAEI